MFSFDDSSSEHELYLKKKLCSWNFLPLDLTEQDLIHCVYLIFEQVLALPELHHLVLTKGKILIFLIFLAMEPRFILGVGSREGGPTSSHKGRKGKNMAGELSLWHATLPYKGNLKRRTSVL